MECPYCGCELLWFLPGQPCSNVACDPVWGLVEREDDKGESDDEK